MSSFDLKCAGEGVTPGGFFLSRWYIVSITSCRGRILGRYVLGYDFHPNNTYVIDYRDVQVDIERELSSCFSAVFESVQETSTTKLLLSKSILNTEIRVPVLVCRRKSPYLANIASDFWFDPLRGPRFKEIKKQQNWLGVQNQTKYRNMTFLGHWFQISHPTFDPILIWPRKSKADLFKWVISTLLKKLNGSPILKTQSDSGPSSVLDRFIRKGEYISAHKEKYVWTARTEQ